MHETVGCFQQKNAKKIKTKNYYDNKEMQCNDNDVDESIVVDHSGKVRNGSIERENLNKFSSDFNIGNDRIFNHFN